MAVKLVVLDLDGTLWDHLDASSLKPPFKLVSRDVVEDSRGCRLRLYPGVREFLRYVKGLGVALAVASWNDPSIVMPIMDALGLTQYFNYVGIEYHPGKHLVIAKIVEWYRRSLGGIEPGEILYVDDRDIHIDDVRRYVGGVKFVRMWVDVKDFKELASVVRGLSSPAPRS